MVLKSAFGTQRTYNQGEIDIENILRKNLDVKEIEIQDISGIKSTLQNYSLQT